MKLLFVLIIAIIYIFESSNACTCVRINPEQHYCGADFAAVIKIGSRHEDTEKQVVYYEFDVKQVLRATEKGKKSLASNRLILDTRGPCRMFSLIEGQELVVTAGVDDNGDAHVGLCNYHDLWSDFKPELKAGFLGGYKCSST
jgi:hypothetical protein